MTHLSALTPDDTLAPPPPTMANPSWWGTDSTRFRASNGEGTIFVKALTPAARDYIDVAASFAAAEAAGRAGLGPVVLGADTALGVIAMADHTATHRTSSQLDLHPAENLEAIVAARKSVWSLNPKVFRTASVFDDVQALASKLNEARADVTPDATWQLRVVADIAARFASHRFDAVLIHGDANSSNALVHRETNEVLLLDFDWATQTDPLQDIGSLILEAGDSDVDSRELFELAWGKFSPADYARARCYAAVEAVRSGLLGAWVDHVEPGTHEYSKFSDWMFLRARYLLGAPALDDYLRML